MTSRPLEEGDLYTGRESEFKTLDDYLHDGKRLVLVFGAPRVGKTSFLKQLARVGIGAYHIHITQLPSAPNLLTGLLLGIHSALGGPLPGVCQTVTEAKDYILSIKKKNEETLICIDGLEPADLPTSQALEDIAWTLSAAGGVSVIVTVRGLPSQLSWSAIGIPYVVIPPFTEQETADTLMVPVRGILAYDLDVVHQIHRFSGGIPYYVQIFGSLIFEKRAAKGWVGKAEAEETLPQVLRMADEELKILWDQCTRIQQVVLCALAEMKGFHGVASPDDVMVYIRRQQYNVSLEKIRSAYDQLLRSGLLKQLGGSTARFESELLRRWVQIHVSCEDVLKKANLHRVSEPKQENFRRREVDWVGVLLWIIAIVLIIGVTWIWRSRETNISIGDPADVSSVNGTLLPGTGPTPEIAAASDGSQGQITYQSRSDSSDDWDIYVMEADGSNPTQLTTDMAEDTLPQFSPDGSKIAFVSDRDGNREIYVMDADGSNQSNLTRSSGDDWDPTWSPDGEYLAFSSFRDGDWDIYICKADGSNVTQLTTMDSAERAPSWSPDGQRIAFMSDAMGNWDIYSMASNGADMVQLTVDSSTDQYPRWSPYGQYLLWGSYRDGNMEIYVALTDGNDKRAVSLDAEADDQAGAWSPWGTDIVYYSNVDGGWDIIVLNLETGDKTNLTSSTAEEQWPSWGP